MGNTENKYIVYGDIEINKDIAAEAREKAAVLAFPEEKQRDLQYIRSILVSAGTNINGAHFLPSEMIKAKNTIANKAIDIEHDQERIIGHIYDAAYVFKDGVPFDPDLLVAEYERAGKNVDDLDIDIVVAGVIHKLRFPEIAQEIARGEWKVSMECLFRTFDIKIGSQIITRDEALALGFDPESLISGFVKVTAGQCALGTFTAARVFRDITFCGMGIVKKPANPHSIIMETAAHREKMAGDPVIIDLERIDALRGENKVYLTSDTEKEEISSSENASVDNYDKDATENSAMIPVQLAGEDSKVYIQLDPETGGIQRVFSVEAEETDPEHAGVRFSGPGIGSPGSVEASPDGLCVSFKKRLTKFNALDQSEGVVLKEHWCALFDEPCPVIGASAKAPECLRNVKNRTVREEDRNDLTRTVREIIDQAPGNTFQTAPAAQAVPIVQSVSSGTINTSIHRENSRQQAARIKEQAKLLRSKLREFVAAEVQGIKVVSEPVQASSLITKDKVYRFKNRVDAFKTAQTLSPESASVKLDGYVLFIGPRSEVEYIDGDRDAAVSRATELVQQQDVAVVLSRLHYKLGDNVIAKDQLLFSRR